MRDRSRFLRWALPLRVFLIVMTMMCVVLAVAYAVLAQWSQRERETAMRRGLEQSADLVAQFLAGRQRSLVGGARVFVQGPYFRAIVAARRRDDILDQSFEAAAQLDADWVFVVDERGILLAKSDEPGASGTDLGGIALVRGALRGQVTSGFGVSRDSLLFQATAIPIAVPGGAPIGALVATKIVDSLLARDVKAVTASDIVFFSRDASNGSHVAASTLPAPLARTMLLGAGVPRATAATSERSKAVLGGRAYATLSGGLTTAGGDAIGGFVVLRQDGSVSGGATAVRRALMTSALVGLFLAGLAALFAWLSVSVPLERLTSAVRRVTEDDGATLPDARSHEGSMLRQLSSAVSGLVRELRERRDVAELVVASEMPNIPAQTTDSQAVPRAARIGRRGIMAMEQRNAAAPAIMPTGMLASGVVLGRRYRIEAMLDLDATASVYRATDEVRGREVAVKLLEAHHGSEIAHSAAHVLLHRNVVAVLDAGEYEERPFLALEYVDGRSLAALLANGARLPEPAVIAIAGQLCRAMQAARDAGIAHGALAPRKLLLRRDGVLKVSGYRAHRDVSRGEIANPRVTPHIVGATIGAPEYMAPEILLGARADARSDLYAAGVMLGECLSGSAQFREESPMAFLVAKLNQQRTTAGMSQLSELRQIIAIMSAPERENRPSSPGDVIELLERLG